MTSPGAWYVVIFLTNAFFSIPVNKDYEKLSSFIWQGQQYIFLIQEYNNSPILCHDLLYRNLDDFPLPQNITLARYVNDMFLTGPSGQETTTLDLLVRYI